MYVRQGSEEQHQNKPAFLCTMSKKRCLLGFQQNQSTWIWIEQRIKQAPSLAANNNVPFNTIMYAVLICIFFTLLFDRIEMMMITVGLQAVWISIFWWPLWLDRPFVISTFHLWVRLSYFICLWLFKVDEEFWFFEFFAPKNYVQFLKFSI